MTSFDSGESGSRKPALARRRFELHPAVAYTVIFAVLIPALSFTYPSVAVVTAVIIAVMELVMAAVFLCRPPAPPPETGHKLREFCAQQGQRWWYDEEQDVVDALARDMGVDGKVWIVPDPLNQVGLLGAIRYSATHSEIYARPDFIILDPLVRRVGIAHELAHLQPRYRWWLFGNTPYFILDGVKEPVALAAAVSVLVAGLTMGGATGWNAVAWSVAAALVGTVGYLTVTALAAVWSRREEHRADREAARFCGPDSIACMSDLLSLESASPGMWTRWARTHPAPQQRIAHVLAHLDRERTLKS